MYRDLVIPRVRREISMLIVRQREAVMT